MASAFQIGIPISEWQDMTPRQLNVLLRAYAQRIENEMRITMLQNYNLANLIRAAVWSKKMPSLESVIERKSTSSQKRKQMSDEEMYAVVCKLNRAFGGDVE